MELMKGVDEKNPGGSVAGFEPMAGKETCSVVGVKL
jgi:hypothetical protein